MVQPFMSSFRNWYALRMSIRLRLTPLRSIGSPEHASAVCSCDTEAFGSKLRKSAKAPATWGAAMEVPLMRRYDRDGTPAVMASPGASKSISGEWLEKEDRPSAFVELPTATALLIQAG